MRVYRMQMTRRDEFRPITDLSDEDLERIVTGPLQNGNTGKREQADDVREQARIVQLARANGWPTTRETA